MDIKKAAKKIVALSGSSVMLAASITGALAYDLSDYPEPFIQDGQFDGKIVVGENAATEDLLGALDIATHLQRASTDMMNGGSGSGMVGDDMVQISESGDILEIGEQIGSVINTLTDDDLEILSDGRIEADGATDYTQIIELDVIPAASGFVDLVGDEEDEEVGFYLVYEQNDELFRYELEFTSGLDSDVEDNRLDDLEDETISMLGQSFSVVTATITDDEEDLTLELIAGDVVDTLEQGQTRNYEVMDADGDVVDYEITLLAVGTSGGDNEARFLVNGESTDGLEEGDTERLSSGLEIGVRDILSLDRNFEGDQGSLVEFYLGANKLTLQVDDAADTEGSVEYNEEDLEDVHISIDYTASVDTNGDGTITINQITWTAFSDDEYFLGEGESLRDAMDEPEGLISDRFDFVFGGLTEPTMYNIEFNPQSDDEYDLSFLNRRGDEYDVPYYHAAGAAVVGLGEEGANGETFHFFERFEDDNTNVITAETFLIEEDDFFVVTDDSGTVDEDADSYVLQFIDVDEGEGIVEFEHIANGESQTIEAQISGSVFSGTVPVATFFTAANITGDITIGGQDFDFWVYDAGDDEVDYTLVVDMNGDGDVAGVDAASNTTTVEIINIVTRGGGVLTLGTAAQIDDVYDGTDTSTLTTTLTTVDDDVDNDVAQTVDIAFTVSGSEVDFSTPTSSSGTFLEADFESGDQTWYVTGYGTLFDVRDDDEDSDDLTIMYPAQQREALVYVTGGAAMGRMSGDEMSSSSSVRVNPVDIGLGVLDTEVSVGADNLIVVGGPCANSIAAELMGNPADCTEGFEPNMGMIRGYDTDNNVAVLVAGFSARDTVRTSQVLAEATVGDEDLEGEAIEVAFPTANGNPVIRQAEMDMDDMDMDEAEDEDEE